MARLAFAASAVLSLFLLAAAHRLPSDLPSEVDFLPAFSSDAAAIRLPSDKPSEESVPKPTVAQSLPSDNPSEFLISKPEDVATESLLPAADAAVRTVPIEVSLIPIRDFPFAHPRVVGRPSWRRLGRHCQHVHRVLRGEFRRAGFIPYGDDMVVPTEQVHRGYEGGRYFAGEQRTGDFHHPAMMEEISVEDLGKQREMGVPRELRPFPRLRHHHRHGDGDGEERGLLKRFLDRLNGH